MRKSRLLNQKNETLRKSRSQEARVAKQRKGRVTPGSGAVWYSKGDVRSTKELIECKRTDKASFSLKAAEVLKSTVQARKLGKRPVFQVEIGKLNLAVIPWEDYVAMRDAEDE